VVAEVVVAGSCGERGAYLGIVQAARDRGVAGVPEFGCEVAACFFGQQFHEGAVGVLSKADTPSSVPLTTD
jgi:hypothetical protein